MKHVSTQSSWRAGIVGCFVMGAFGVAGCGEATPKEPSSVGATEQSLNGYNYSDNRAWSQSPPNGLAVSQVPQFVEIGFDDNFISGLGATTGGMTWILNFLRAKRKRLWLFAPRAQILLVRIAYFLPPLRSFAKAEGNTSLPTALSLVLLASAFWSALARPARVLGAFVLRPLPRQAIAIARSTLMTRASFISICWPGSWKMTGAAGRTTPGSKSS